MEDAKTLYLYVFDAMAVLPILILAVSTRLAGVRTASAFWASGPSPALVLTEWSPRKLSSRKYPCDKPPEAKLVVRQVGPRLWPVAPSDRYLYRSQLRLHFACDIDYGSATSPTECELVPLLNRRLGPLALVSWLPHSIAGYVVFRPLASSTSSSITDMNSLTWILRDR